MRLVVIGGGIGGAESVRLASSLSTDITLIEPKKRLECQALYPEYLSGKVDIEDICAELSPFCSKLGVEFVNERALGITSNEVITERDEVEFDVAIVAVGTTQNFFGIEGGEKTFSVHTLEETIKTKRELDRRNPSKIVIVGSGLTGVEVSCELAESLEAEIYIVELMERVLPTFHPRVSSYVEKVLKKRGVHMLVSKEVVKIHDDKVEFSDGTSLECDMVIWTAGIRPVPFVDSTPFPKIKGWIKVDDFLRVDDENYSSIFAIGDNSWVEIDGKIATKTAIEAERQAKHTVKNLEMMMKDEKLKKYKIKASMDSPIALISLGCECAIGVYGGLCIRIPKLVYKYKKWIDTSFVKKFKS